MQVDEIKLSPPLIRIPEDGRVAEEKVGEVISDFLLRQSYYSSPRNAAIDFRTSLFDGEHWNAPPEDDTEYQLVFNYLRNVVLRFAATFSRQPKPRVPSPTASVSPESEAANRREKFLMALWPQLMRAWGDVEMNASKKSFGVLQVLWAPEGGQPEEVKVGKGEDQTTRKQYTSSPFKFRSINPKYFYPVYKTFDKPNDFICVYRYDPSRLVADLEEIYGVILAPVAMPMLGEIIGASSTADLIEYWTKDVYALIAQTTVLVRTQSGRRAPIDIEKTMYTVLEWGPNNQGEIPFWVLENMRADPDADPTDGGSISDLDDLFEINKHYNEIMSEEAEEIVTNIHRPLIYKGGEAGEHSADPNSFEFKPGATLPIANDEELGPLPWTAEPNMVQLHLDRTLESLKDLSFLGEAGFGRVQSNVTGIGFKIALTPMEQILDLKLPLRTDLLQSVCAYLLKSFEEHANEGSFRGWIQDQYGQFGIVELQAKDVDRQYFVTIDYGNLLPRDDYMHEQNEVYKFKTGAQSLFTTIENLGVDDAQKEIERIKDELQDPVLNPERAMLIKQAQAGGQQTQQQPAPINAGANPRVLPSPSSAQPGTSPVMPNTLGGMGGMPGGGQMGMPGGETQPPVPNAGAFGRGAGAGGFGPGQLAPFINRPQGGGKP
jgi:hypothetical protein